jgi:hypothetical protein
MVGHVVEPIGDVAALAAAIRTFSRRCLPPTLAAKEARPRRRPVRLYAATPISANRLTSARHL